MIPVPAKNNSPQERKDRPGVFYGRIDMADGTRRRVKLGTDYDKAVVRQNTLQSRQSLIAQGIVTAEQYEVADGGLRNIADLIKDFCAELRGARRTRGYVDELSETVSRYAKAAKIKTVNQASTASIERHLSGILRRGRSTETRNKAATRLHTFFQWVVDRKHLQANPARAVKRVASDGGVDRPRSLTVDEFLRLLDSTPDKYRRMSYLLGARAGLRVSEAHRLRWEHMDLDGGWIVLPKHITKMKRSAELPMHPQIRVAARRLPHRSLYVCGPSIPSRYTWLRDLKRAGIIDTKEGVRVGSWTEDQMIGYRDERGMVLSRRCLRKSCGTHMAISGATQIQVMNFLRHRSAEMTNELYTDSLLLGLRGAVDGMDKTTKVSGTGVGSIDYQPKPELRNSMQQDPNEHKSAKG